MSDNKEGVKPQSESLALIKQAMSDPSVQPEKLQQLLVIKKEWEADEARKEFNTAMHLAQSEMPIVVRDAKNTHTNSRYAKLETVARAIKPVYMSHGFTISFGEEPCDRPDWVLIIATVRHIGNHVEKYRRYGPIDDKGPKGGDVKTKLHGCQSTMSYMERNLICSIFGVTIADRDNDGNTSDSPTAITEKQVSEIETYLGNLPKDMRGKILKFAKAESIAQIETQWYQLIVSKLRASLAKQEGKS